jgi:5-dehydro-2-deoxygluconokinase
MLPFDQRESFQAKLFGWKGPLTTRQTVEIVAAKRVIYDGFLSAIELGAPAKAAAILVDEQFGTGILRDARHRGFMTACPAEKSGQKEFDFEYGEHFARHIESVSPTFCKVLVRYNPEGDVSMNRRQSGRLRRLSEYLRQTGRKFMFELLVPPETDELLDLGPDAARFDRAERPRLMVEAIVELQNAGVEPDVWKVEGLENAEHYESVVRAARRNGRDSVGCIVLGRGAEASRVESWLSAAASVSGFIGFAVGRTTFWNTIIDWRADHLSREEATLEIARRYLQWVEIFEHSGRAPCSRINTSRFLRAG